MPIDYYIDLSMLFKEMIINPPFVRPLSHLDGASIVTIKRHVRTIN
jgi:hypothetical protein